MTRPHKLMTIKEAADVLHSSITDRSLHRARRDGRLWAKKIGNKYYTNMPALTEFLQCPDQGSPRGSTTAETNSNGSFGTEVSRSGQDMAMASTVRLRQHLRNTSQAESHPPAEVRHLRGN